MRERIVAFEQNLCVRAGAGAGKTGCLVDTYLGLLEGKQGKPGLNPSQIVAITFTNKAADEMRQRIQMKLAQRAGGEGRQARTWSAALSSVEWSPIVTIHSFCVSLLREFGALLDLDPEFAVLEAADYAALLQEVIGDLLRRRLAQGDPCLGRLLGTYSLGGRQGLATLLERLSQGLSTQGLSAAQAKENTAQAFAREMAEGAGLVDRLGQIMAELRAAVARGDVGKGTKYADKVAQLIELWPQARARLAQSPGQVETLDQLAGLFSGRWSDKLTPLRQEAAGLLKELGGLAHAPACAALSDDALALAEELEGDLALELSRRAALSFDHLLLLGLGLLRQHPPVLAELRRRFRAILVDEFQDVNPVQGRLVFLLAGLEDASGQAGPGESGADLPRLLLVGDPKQSIYAFRGADKKVFDLAQGRLETLALGNNYRSNGELVILFNQIFSNIFQLPDKYDLSSDEFHIFSHDDHQDSPTAPDPPPQSGRLEVLRCHGPEPDAPLDEWRLAEAQAMAGRIGQLVDSGEYQPGQVVVLMRAMTRAQVYEQALARAGVPFYTVGGRGFYQAREIADLALGLRAGFFPGDNLALAGAMRSALGGLDDASLLALTHPEDQEKYRPLGAALGHDLPDWVTPQQARLWQEWRELLTWLRAWGRRLTPSELLTGLMEARDLPSLHLSRPGGPQKLANLRKLVEMTRSSALPPGGSQGFAEQLWQLVNDPSDEAIAPLLHEGADVVRLMSVHQAKGLEFPVVVLADLAAKPPANARSPLGPGGVLAVKPWDPETGTNLASSLTTRQNRRSQAVEAAEAARLFYVACTRARERLILCLNQSKKQGLWGKWAAEVVAQIPGVELVEALPSSPASPMAIKESATPAPYLPDGPGPRDAQGAALVSRVLEPKPHPLATVRESVSSLENWLACPRLYLVTSRLGLDTALLVPGVPGHANSGPGAVNLGSLAHRALQLSDLTTGPAALQPVLDQMDLSPEDRGLAAQVAAGWWQTDLPDLLASVAPQDMHREKSFHLLLPGQGSGPALELRGEFDLLARLPSGRWLLVDYKVTDNISPAEYQAQMALYAMALWQGQGRAGEPPQAILCYLGRQGAQLRELAFTPQDLEAWAARARAAAQGIANLPPNPNPSALPIPSDCSTRHCHLRGSGVCEEG